jgi:pSer/pThr/pTyr-binding forkhead associated (FHA) protein
VVPHLGPYAPLIAAIRDELQGFVVSHLRLHLAIAERDRYLLTSIEVKGIGPAEDDLLRRFIQEFKPEQIKHYFAKEVIGALPNAAAIDLSQFAGLNARDDADREDDDYGELLAELRSGKPGSSLRPYEVSLLGRWSEAGPTAGASQLAAPATPLAGRTVAIEIEDAKGGRRTYLNSVQPGRRYVIGKGEGCDVAVDGVYASRRHCEIWLDHGAWWVTDAGSTNGVRVERGGKVLGRSLCPPGSADQAAVLEVVSGARIVLSARADGNAADYPRVGIDGGRDAEALSTPIAAAVGALATPSTPIVAKQANASEWTITAQMVSGARTVELPAAALPFTIGRSRRQALVIDWAHGGVSGHHLDVTAIDATSVSVTVHGDNGVVIDGTSYPPGSRARWNAGESMVLGRAVGREPECRLTLAHRPPPATSVR